jgi:hypothetical protein
LPVSVGRMKITHALVMIAASAVLTACSSEPDALQVAAVPAASGSTTAPAGTSDRPSPPAAADDSGPASGRPQFRLDDSPRRRSAIQVAYNQCLLDHGATENTGREGSAAAAAPGEDENGRALGPLVADPVPPAASAACLTKLPLMPPELEAATNPDFHRQSLAYVACLKAGGLHVTLLTDKNLDWTYTEGHTVPDDSGRLEQDCLTESFKR